jgi:DhnA family fructose-bisphosphate aldolase class Ia
MPTILKMNSANSLGSGALQDQAVTASVKDALRLGCVGVGFTIYPGSDSNYGMMEELREIIREARACGLPSIVWSYPRGGKITKEGETALDVVAYAAHMAALMGAHVIKVKPPKEGVDLEAARATYEKARVPMGTLKDRVAHVVQACFAGKRLVVFSGGDPKGTEGLLDEVRQIRDGGGHGSIMGRNSFQRPARAGARAARPGGQDLPRRGVSGADVPGRAGEAGRPGRHHRLEQGDQAADEADGGREHEPSRIVSCWPSVSIRFSSLSARRPSAVSTPSMRRPRPASTPSMRRSSSARVSARSARNRATSCFMAGSATSASRPRRQSLATASACRVANSATSRSFTAWWVSSTVAIRAGTPDRSFGRMAGKVGQACPQRRAL